MRFSLRRNRIILLSVIIMAVMFTGCTIGNTQFVFGEVVDREIVFDMGGYGDCDKEKAFVYLLIAKAEYEDIFGETVWQMQIEDLSMEEFVKNNTLSELLQRESMSALAEYEGFELSDEQLGLVTDAARELYKSASESELSRLQISLADIEAVFKAYLMSELVYDAIADTVNTEISDSEAKVITVQYIQLGDAEDLESISAEEEFAKADVSEVNICRGELAEKFGSKVENVVFALEKGEVSEAVTIDGKRYVFKSISAYDAQKTELNKAVMLEKRKQDAFMNKYAEFMDSSEYKVNEELWEEISISDFGDVTLDGFYDICDKYGI